MILLALAVIATATLVIGIVLRRRWIRILTGSLIWLMITYVLLFYSGSVSRAVLRHGVPASGEVDGFYTGIQLLQAALLDSYLLVLYLSLLSLVNSVWRRESAPGSRD